MTLKNYIQDKILSILIYSANTILLYWLFSLYRVTTHFKIVFLIMSLLTGFSIFALNFFKKRKHYNEYLAILKNIDQKYLITELIKEPNFNEGKIQYQILTEINKSYNDKINEYKTNIDEFKEYVEMWIHEVKTPVSTISLIAHNKNEKKYKAPLNKLNNYLNQILYYVRSEVSEKDYIIKESKLLDILNAVLLYNKDDILENNIEIKMNIKKETVLTDSKWLEFMLNQIINNSIKRSEERRVGKEC